MLVARPAMRASQLPYCRASNDKTIYRITGDDVTQSATASNESTSPTFPLVGIGASAGGLEAISELMAEIPAASGMAFLVVQHLDPSRRSILPEILAKRVSMPVVEAVEGMDVEADHLYVIPANTSMSVVERRIRLRPRDEALGPPMPVDDLLDSLARDQGPNAIGVVLSGSGSDGALGLQAIQREGGITFAQDEGTAHFNSMPRGHQSGLRGPRAGPG